MDKTFGEAIVSSVSVSKETLKEIEEINSVFAKLFDLVSETKYQGEHYLEYSVVRQSALINLLNAKHSIVKLLSLKK